MNKNTLLMVFALLFSFCTMPAFAAETYTLDPGHTYVLWHIKHFGYSTQSGKWYASGKLILDKDKPENSKVNADIKIADIVTGIPKLDTHLKGKDFFDVQKFPTATFVSDKVDVTGAKTANVHGILTLHGVAKPVTLAVTLNQDSVSPMTNKPTVGFTATTTIKRSDFGISAYLPGLGDEVKIDIESEASTAKN